MKDGRLDGFSPRALRRDDGGVPALTFVRYGTPVSEPVAPANPPPTDQQAHPRPAQAPKPRTPETYATLMAKLCAEEGVPVPPTCVVHGTALVARGCPQCIANDDARVSMKMAEKGHATVHPKVEPWKPGCPDDHWLPSPTEFGS
jgi:hypothetical protein